MQLIRNSHTVRLVLCVDPVQGSTLRQLARECQLVNMIQASKLQYEAAAPETRSIPTVSRLPLDLLSEIQHASPLRVSCCELSSWWMGA